MCELKTADKVKISGAAGVCYGRVEDVRPVAELPELAEFGFPTAGEFAPKSIMQEYGVSRVASISYHASPFGDLAFVALEISGEWFDLKHQKLEIEVVGRPS